MVASVALVRERCHPAEGSGAAHVLHLNRRGAAVVGAAVVVARGVEDPVPELAVEAIAPAVHSTRGENGAVRRVAVARERATPLRVPVPPTPTTWTGVAVDEGPFLPFPSSPLSPSPQQSTPPEERRAQKDPEPSLASAATALRVPVPPTPTTRTAV